MKNILKFGCFIYAIIICSCSGSYDSIFGDKTKESKLPVTIELGANRMELGGPEVLNISDIQIFDSILVIIGSVLSSEYFFHTFSIPQKTYCGSFVVKGRGAEEMMSPMMRGYSMNNNEVLVNLFDLNSKTTYALNLNQSILNQKTVIAPLYELKGITFDVIQRELNYIAIHSKNNELSCSIIDSAAHYKDIVSLYSEVPVMENYSALSSAIAFDDKSNQLAIAMIKLPQVNFLNVKTKEKKTVAVSKEFQEWKTMLQKEDEDRIMYYLDCAQSDKYFIALYANVDFENWINDTYESHLHVFDWEGNIIYDFKIGQTLKAIAYDKLHNTLYGVDVNDELYSYNFGTIH